jgi:hypothetical protein
LNLSSKLEHVQHDTLLARAQFGDALNLVEDHHPDPIADWSQRNWTPPQELSLRSRRL